MLQHNPLKQMKCYSMDEHMKVPQSDYAMVSAQKITEYLLSLSHPEGHDKAVFFNRIGFSVSHWEQLADALLRHVQDYELANMAPNQFGIRYIVEGALITPGGRNPLVRSVWFIASGEDIPRLVTAYPL